MRFNLFSIFSQISDNLKMNNLLQPALLILFLGLACNPLKKEFEVHGHQGFRSVYPGNTLPSFKYAIENNVTILEMDVVLSKDKKLIVHHDHHLEKGSCLDATGKIIAEDIAIQDLAYEQIKKYNCGIANPRFPGQQTVTAYQPSLEEVIDLIKSYPEKKITLSIETKHYPALDIFVTPEEFAGILYDLLKEKSLLNSSYIQSFDYRILQAFKRLHPNAVLVALFEGNTVDYAREAKRYGASIVSPNYLWLNKEIVYNIHANGIRVIPWTVNDEKAVKNLLEMNVDGIISDNPLVVFGILKGK